ncbi:MAG TPA: hypothetical protein VFR89_08120, partial [candidate division Zixibacteria bacterium]|nr:hypothetical protein [candidate division Zixibacteria bacterium]
MRRVNLLLTGILIGLASPLFALPKNRVPEPAPVVQQPAKTRAVPFTPVVVDDEKIREQSYTAPFDGFRYLGPSQIEQAASPYVDVRVGIPETPGGNNHMRRQVAL